MRPRTPRRRGRSGSSTSMRPTGPRPPSRRTHRPTTHPMEWNRTVGRQVSPPWDTWTTTRRADRDSGPSAHRRWTCENRTQQRTGGTTTVHRPGRGNTPRTRPLQLDWDSSTRQPPGANRHPPCHPNLSTPWVCWADPGPTRWRHDRIIMVRSSCTFLRFFSFSNLDGQINTHSL